MKRATIGGFVVLGISLALYLGVLASTSIALAQRSEWSSTASEWVSTIWWWSIWLMGVSAILIAILIAAQIVWAYLPKASSRR
ncbi:MULTISPECIES: hypothetical protein [unclassified Salinibacterium]|uniref:hypothetical protein n=1 Tax=unclassified Salinibacterium TaxID=2632331 RepID=UPI0018CE9AD5|nr:MULTISPECIES: hypothetical protein [unclassified Salinibacterium]MBH0055145.1 hypothetical protein [Salinibacterium sp. SWN139]MBH0084560.1 hypothetical protein [Salinibacterium sp. SWN167]